MLKMDDESGLRQESCHLLEIYALGGRPLLLSTDPDDLPHPPRPTRLFKVASI